MTNATKLALEESLKRLLLKKPLDKITTTDLTLQTAVSQLDFLLSFQRYLRSCGVELSGGCRNRPPWQKTSSTWHEGLLSDL